MDQVLGDLPRPAALSDFCLGRIPIKISGLKEREMGGSPLALPPQPVKIQQQKPHRSPFFPMAFGGPGSVLPVI